MRWWLRDGKIFCFDSLLPSCDYESEIDTQRKIYVCIGKKNVVSIQLEHKMQKEWFPGLYI